MAFAKVGMPLAKGKADWLLMLLDGLLIETRNCPTLFEARLTLPVAAKLGLFMDVVKGFLQRAEHLLDAQSVLIPIQTILVLL